MTAEVAILNKTAVAVAADSAVTVGGTKVHRTTTKIFAISDAVPIGAMIYGYSEINGMPLEIILKMFRSEHGKEEFLTVGECYARLRGFLADKRFRIEAGQDESLTLFSIEIVEFIRDMLADIPTDNRNLKLLSDIIEQDIEYYNTLRGVVDFSPPPLKRFRINARGVVNSVVETVFEDIQYSVPRSLFPKFTELVYSALCSPYISDYSSGLVVFGFGEKELFPHLVAHEFDANPFGLLRSIQYDASNPINDGPVIVPFADREVMDMVIQGTTHYLKTITIEMAKEVSSEIGKRTIEENLPPDIHAVAKVLLQKNIDEVMVRVKDNFNGFVEDKYVMKMIDVIRNMPKEDLAILAEALVEVTALKIMASEAVESVAGPVDVCIVTKGDGLIWIKRKHYFDLDKNLHYLNKRFGIDVPLLLGGTNARR